MYFSIHCGTIVAALVTIVTVTIYNNTVYKGSNLDVHHRWMDKVATVLHTMECYSVINRRYWISCTEVDEPRAYHAEWSKSEREKQISYTNTYTQNLEKRYWWTYLQGRSRHRGFPGGLMVKKSPANAGDTRDMGSIPGSGRSPGGRNGNPL